MRFSPKSRRQVASVGCRSGRPRVNALLFGVAAVAVTGLVGGCDVKSFFDPSELGTFDKHPIQKPILSSISSIEPGVDDPMDEFYNAGEVAPGDLNVISRDYVIGKNDLVNVSVTDLVGPGVETTKVTRVSESGNISLPLIGQVKAEGLTEAQLEQSIVDSYRNANLIQNAQVSATVAEARARTFSVLGAVNAPGQYAITQSDFRVLDALVLARDVLQSVDNLYIIRAIDEDPKTGPAAGAPTAPMTPAAPGGSSDPLAPRTQANQPTNVALMQTAPSSGDLAPAAMQPAGAAGPVGAAPVATPPREVPAANNTPAPAPAAAGAPPVSPAATPSPSLTPMPTATPFAFAAPTPPAATRTIRIPLDALRNGDLRYNVVIRPRDMLIAPVPVIGEYYMSGHVARVGVYSLTGRKITMKQAVVSAGMIDGVSIPQRTDLIRRIGPDREVFARMDLDAIWNGTSPDIYLKPYDIVHVGTNFIAPFIAAIRGGFRITYGFGFLYDRNYAPQQSTTG